MNIVFLTTVLPGQKASGGEIGASNFIAALKAAGHCVTIVGYARHGTDYVANADEIVIAERHIETGKAKAYPALWMGSALLRSLPYSAAKFLTPAYLQALRWLLNQNRFDVAVIDHAQVGFLLDQLPAKLPVIFNAHNVEATMYADQAKTATGLRRYVFEREARLMARLEEKTACRAEQVWTVTAADRLWFVERGATGIAFALPSAFAAHPRAARAHTFETDVCLLGTWTWSANAEGLRWFFDRIYPLLPASLRIDVGGSGAGWLKDKWSNVTYRGFVPDAYRFLKSSKVIAIPSTAGGGVQLKTLDAIATGARIVSTPIGIRGIEDPPATVRVADTPQAFARELMAFCALPATDVEYAEALRWSDQRRERFNADIKSAIGRVAGTTMIQSAGCNVDAARGRFPMFGLQFRPLTLDQASRAIVEAAKRKQTSMVVTPNVDHLVMLRSDPAMRDIYENAAFVFADGAPVVWLSRMIARPGLPMRVTGADLMPSICAHAADSGLKVFFMGGQQGVAQRAAQALQARYPKLDVAGTYCPPLGFERDPVESDRMAKLCNEANTDILFLGLGTPKQEKWAAANLDKLNVGPILCIGAAFDFAAGTAKRAPLLVQNAGFEWCWRLLHEPGRLWKRYLVRDSKFVYLAAREIVRANRARRSSQ